MHMHSRKLLLASAVAMAMAVSSGVVSAATGTAAITEARQESQIWTTYALSPYLRASDLKVSVEGGKATLSGNVAENVNKDLANEIALGVKGITEVDNQIIVNADYVPPKPGAERGFADAVEDASISAAVKSKLMWSKQADGMSTEVSTRFGRVTLRGEASTAADRALAERLALNTNGVLSVDNQIKVNAQKASVGDSSKSAAKDAGADISDSWITTKVKSTLLYSSNVAGTAIDVSTDKGIVSLSGKLGSGAEQALAIELAQNVRGVKSVQSKELTF